MWKNFLSVGNRPMYCLSKKKNEKSNMSNYRPVSLLSIVGKTMEKAVYDKLYTFLSANFLISKWQSGFLPGYSTVTHLIEIYHHFCEALSEGKEIRVIFCDISKAFDRVWHTGLLFKLEKMEFLVPY